MKRRLKTLPSFRAGGPSLTLLYVHITQHTLLPSIPRPCTRRAVSRLFRVELLLCLLSRATDHHNGVISCIKQVLPKPVI